jgi:hypothetical protein
MNSVCHERDDALILQPVGRPTEEARVHVVRLGLLRRGLADVGGPNPLIDLRVLAVLVVLVLILLIGIVGRIAEMTLSASHSCRRGDGCSRP